MGVRVPLCPFTLNPDDEKVLECLTPSQGRFLLSLYSILPDSVGVAE